MNAKDRAVNLLKRISDADSEADAIDMICNFLEGPPAVFRFRNVVIPLANIAYIKVLSDRAYVWIYGDPEGLTIYAPGEEVAKAFTAAVNAQAAHFAEAA